MQAKETNLEGFLGHMALSISELVRHLAASEMTMLLGPQNANSRARARS